MALRLSGGELRSRGIRVPRGSALRPTSARVKEALFSILGERIVGAGVLDLFAGTGAVGFEALSRGASHATFVESHRQTAAAITGTAQNLGIAERVRVIHASAERAAPRLRGTYAFVYIDPPYANPAPTPLLRALRGTGAIDACTILVYEHGQMNPSVCFPGFVTEREARYGEAVLQFMRIDD